MFLTGLAVVAGGAAWAGGGPAMGAAAIDQGYLRFNGVCGYCHGPDGVGSTFAPSLVDLPIDPKRFRAMVLEGGGTGASVMRGFAGDPNLAPCIGAIEAYLQARQRGETGRGRPPRP